MTQIIDERMEALETKISYQEHMIQELNEVVISQQNQVDALTKSLNQLRDYMQNNSEQPSPPEQEAPPPHY